MNDLFDWGTEKFVKGLTDSSKNATKRKKSYQEQFMEALLETDEDETKKEQEESQ